MASGRRQGGNVKVGNMGRIHDGAIGVANGDGCSGNLLVNDGSVDGEEVAGAACVGNSEMLRRGGRTGGRERGGN